MKKIVSVVLSLVSVIALAIPAFAEELSDDPDPDRCYAEQYVTAPISEVPDSTTALNSEQSASDDSDSLSDDTHENAPDSISEEDSIISDAIVAIMYLCVSGPHAPYYFGHAWICIKNISEETIMIGSHSVAPGEMASFGLQHFDGMHYNDEMNDYRGETVSAREYRLTRNDLDKAEKEITNSRWGWYEYLAHNCTNFATSVWNKVTGQHFFAFCFPFIIQIQMAGTDLKKIDINR